MSTYSEIEALKNYLKNYDITILKTDVIPNSDCFWVDFTVDGNSWKIIIEDEYKDFDASNQLVCLFLVLKSLELYADSEDYLDWSNEMGLIGKDSKCLAYYKKLQKYYSEIDSLIGKIDSCISDYNYQLRTGVVRALLENN